MNLPFGSNSLWTRDWFGRRQSLISQEKRMSFVRSSPLHEPRRGRMAYRFADSKRAPSRSIPLDPARSRSIPSLSALRITLSYLLL
jgi:hypothetical protein